MDFIKFSEAQIPSKIEDSILHRDRIHFIKNMKYIQNMIFYGHEGKTVLINLLLGNIFKNIKIKSYDFSLSNKIIHCNHSDYHLDLNIKTINKNVQILIDLIKEYTSTSSIVNSTYKVVVIYNFDLLNEKYQLRFRTIIEKLSFNNRFILHSSSISKIIHPIRSRCLCIRIPIITEDEGFNFIKSILNVNKQNMIKIIQSATLMGIISIKKLLYILFIKIESKTYKIRYTINFNESLEFLCKELYSKKPLVKKICTLNCIILKLLETDNSPQIIMKYLLDNLIKNDDITYEKKYNIIKNTAYHEHLINKSRVIVNLETYIVYLLKELNDS